MDHYQVLGIDRHASRRDIKEAYRRLARTAHPDKGGSAPDFARVQHAFQTLYDPRTRAVYNQVELAPGAGARRHAARAQHPPSTPPTATQSSQPSSQQQHSQAQESQPKATTTTTTTTHASLAQQLGSWAWPGDEDENGSDEGKNAAAGDSHTTKESASIKSSTGAGTSPESGAAAGQEAGAANDDEGTDSAPPPGVLEGALLQVLVERGVVVDGATQLVVVCEVCCRPATRTCWVCSADICELCTRSLHAKGAWGSHWPLVNAPGSMAERLGRQEFERKRLEDAAEFEQAQPGFVPQALRALSDAAQEAAMRAAVRPNKLLYYDRNISRFYLWTQTDSAVYLAVHVPYASEATPLAVDVDARGVLCVHAKGSSAAPLLHRQLAGAVDQELGVDVMCTPDQRYAVAVLPKAGASSSAKPPRWRTLFASTPPPPMGPPATSTAAFMQSRQGSASSSATPQPAIKPAASSNNRSVSAMKEGAQQAVVPRPAAAGSALVPACNAKGRDTMPEWMQGGCEAGGAREAAVGSEPLYRLAVDEDEVVLELDLPRWVGSGDVCVHVWGAGLRVDVAGGDVLQLWRTLRLGALSAAGGNSAKTGGSSTGTGGSTGGTALQAVVKPEDSSWSLTEVVRGPKRVKQLIIVMPRAAPSGPQPPGRPKPAPPVGFAEDGDKFGLTGLLQAAVFHATGSVYVQQPTSAAAPASVSKPQEVAAAAQQHEGRWVRQATELPADAQRLLRAMSRPASQADSKTSS